MKKFIEMALVLVILLLTASISSAQFTYLESPFTQTTFGTSTSFLGGVAFAPNGDVWSDDCVFGSGTLFRFPLQGHPAAVNSGTSGLTGCGLTNHPDGNLYSNTSLGVAEISNPMTSDIAPKLLQTIGSPGNALGITVDPQTKHLVYVGSDCSFSDSCTIYDLDPLSSEPSSSTLVVLPSSVASFVDGIAFDPSGNFLLLSTRSPVFALTILHRNGSVAQQVLNQTCGDGCTSHEPDGIAFHAGSPTFVVTNNTDGTMSRFDFPSNDLTMAPAVSLFASGGRRGDLSQVGPDGCLYISQDLATNTDVSDIAQICSGFAQPTGSSESVVLHFTTTNTTRIATAGTGNDAQSLALTFTSVIHPFDVTVTFFYEPTDISTGTTGVGISDGDCESTATDITDADCKLTTFTYQTLENGDRIVPHIFASHNNEGVWDRAETTALPIVDYTGPVYWYHAFTNNPALVNADYTAGWNILNPQLYDRPGTNTSFDFVNNITTFSKNCNPPNSCVGTADPGVGGKTPTLNDVVAAAPPNPPAGTPADTVELLVPVPGISPFPYFKGLPMLVAFELENESKETSITNALTLPHSVNVATFGPSTLSDPGENIPVQIPQGFPATFTYNRFTKAYYIFLSPAPYVADGKTKYTLQINSDLFPQPVTATFVVKKNLF